ncbi:MAG: hypothetical protein ACK44W_18110 [Planctomycetota bacterium]
MRLTTKLAGSEPSSEAVPSSARRVATGSPVPFTIVNPSSTAPVSRRNFTSRRFPLKSRTSDPRAAFQVYITGWRAIVEVSWPELPATM